MNFIGEKEKETISFIKYNFKKGFLVNTILSVALTYKETKQQIPNDCHIKGYEKMRTKPV